MSETFKPDRGDAPGVVANPNPPWRASYFWMREQRDAAQAEVARLTEALEVTHGTAQAMADMDSWIAKECGMVDDGTNYYVPAALGMASEEVRELRAKLASVGHVALGNGGTVPLSCEAYEDYTKAMLNEVSAEVARLTEALEWYASGVGSNPAFGDRARAALSPGKVPE